MALCRLAPAKLEGRDKGDLISMITSDVELIEVFYAHTISPAFIAFFVSLFMCICIGLINPVLALIAFAAYLTIGILIPLIASKLSGKAGRDYRDESGALTSYMLDSLRGVKQSIQYRNGTARLKQMQAFTDSLSQKQRKMKAQEGRTVASSTAAVVLFSALMVVTGVLLFRAGSLTAEGVAIATTILMSSFGPVLALAGLPGNLGHTFAAANRIFDLMDEQPAVEAVTDGSSIPFSGMRLKDVDFSYSTDTIGVAADTVNANILTAFNMPLPPQRIVGVTGKSGSGKSTALKLLMRFWDATGGEVLFSEQDIKSINTSNLRQSQAYLTQDTQLFTGSIQSNILIANPDASIEDVKQACQKASLHDFIDSLPDGYSTEVGELGDRLSDGEKQRLGLARVFLHDAPMILLDEPTSNLDSLNEAVILKSLYQSAEQKTVVLVSHRASTMRIADQVYTVENGRVS
jgi:ATP-binding cassette subfamily C protein